MTLQPLQPTLTNFIVPIVDLQDLWFLGHGSWLAGCACPFESSVSRATRKRRCSSTGSLLASSIICSSVAMNNLYSATKTDDRRNQFTISVEGISTLPLLLMGSSLS